MSDKINFGTVSAAFRSRQSLRSYYANTGWCSTTGAGRLPSIALGRDDGLAYWGQFGRVKVSAGVFDVPSTLGNSNVLSAERVMVDLFDVKAAIT